MYCDVDNRSIDAMLNTPKNAQQELPNSNTLPKHLPRHCPGSASSDVRVCPAAHTIVLLRT